jgi:hypothetical protein
MDESATFKAESMAARLGSCQDEGVCLINVPIRLLKNDCAWLYGVKIWLNMLIFQS